MKNRVIQKAANKILKWAVASRNALRASAIGRNELVVGMEFDRYGRHLGRRLIWRYPTGGIKMMVDPLSLTRYFEFPFAAESISKDMSEILDVSSPRLFSLWLSEQQTEAKITMINPDSADIEESKRAANALKLPNIQVKVAGLEWLITKTERFDLIYSISVIEHISGKYDDTDAARLMYQAVKPGGKMIITVPVDRVFWSEYRDHDPYGIRQAGESGKFFFQRYYDLQALHDRIIDNVGRKPSRVAWFGELEPGCLQQYEADWMRLGVVESSRDPEHVARLYDTFHNWQQMPGKGVCGLVFEKPHND